jgi:hypothetical protein
MPKLWDSKWSLRILILIHIASLVYFIYNWTRAPPFPPTLVINLDSRRDKWEQIEAEFTNWPVPLERISAIRYNPGWKGCTLSHIKCLETAKRLKYPWVLCVEDDCVLKTDALAQFQALLPYLWHHKRHWDVFSGGLTSVSDIHVVSQEHSLFRARGLTTHFCLIHENAYDKILRHIPKTAADMKDPIDVWYSNHLRIWTTYPFLAVQRPAVSDIEQKTANYTDLFESAESKLGSMI